MKYIAPSNEKKNWKAKDAIGTYCKVCKVKIPYDAQKNLKAVVRHMKQKHPDLLQKFKKKSAKKRKQGGKMHDFFPKHVKKVKLATKGDQEHFTKHVAIWTACSLRPFAIAEDAELQSIIDIATQVDGSSKFPPRNTNKGNVDKIANEIRLKMRTVIAEKCHYFSSTSDLWSSRTMDAFMAFTVHFLCSDFHQYNYTFAVKPTVGKHTANMIKGYMQRYLTNGVY